mmetsp:Transcript_7332/g.8788  ORF Transcript_7332/g.8788 Transcript_7332/m.8788 type:complete len:235 (-) Transcript_7332:1344-2048(-)
MAMLLEVETELFGGSELHQVVIERLLADFDALCSLFERELDKDTIMLAAPVVEPPLAHLFDYLLNCALLDARLATVELLLLQLLIRLLILSLELGIVDPDGDPLLQDDVDRRLRDGLLDLHHVVLLPTGVLFHAVHRLAVFEVGQLHRLRLQIRQAVHRHILATHHGQGVLVYHMNSIELGAHQRRRQTLLVTLHGRAVGLRAQFVRSIRQLFVDQLLAVLVAERHGSHVTHRL